MSFKIIGAGKAHPGFVLTNEALSGIVDTSDEWISTRTGIKSRFVSTKETLLEMSLEAVREALDRSGVEARDLDLIICTTIQGDYITPSLACQIQKEIGAACPAFDLNAACTGFIYALDVAKSYFDSGRARIILIVSAEQMSKFVNWEDRETCVLFGDGAGAVVARRGTGLLAIKVTASGDDKLLAIPGMYGNNPYWEGGRKDPFLHMQGREVFKFAVSVMCRDIADVLETSRLSINDVKKVIPHQANLRIIRHAAEKLGIRDEQIVLGIDRYGNTSSASIPILLGEIMGSGEIGKGDIVVLSAFGGGLSSGACIMEI